MEYSIQSFAKLAGISTRTLRYYDEIGLLKPLRINSSGYRIYGENEVDKLQQIMFFRELGVNLEIIKGLMESKNFIEEKALKEHRQNLLKKREELDRLIETVEKTIKNKQGEIIMSNKEKFEGFKKNLVEENEKKYGKEAREKFGEEKITASNAKVMGLTEADYEKTTDLAQKIKGTLSAALKTGDIKGDMARRAVELHKEWLMLYWSEYSKEAHIGLGEMYVQDERFKEYYDKEEPGTAEFLRDAIKEWAR